MNSEAAIKALLTADTRQRISLIRRCALSDAEVAEIAKAELALSASFEEAALRLGLVTREDIEAARALDHRYALVPKRKVAPGERLVLAHDPYAPRSERVRALRTELLLRRDATDEADMVAVLSPCAGEGRSQLAAELAIAYAQLGRPTLLVDADLRHPQQHALFGADNQHGLSDAMVHDAEPYLQPVEGLPHMFLLTAGPAQSNPLELLCDGRFERLMEDWRHAYAFVVFDTAPVGQYSDGLAVAQLAGRVLAVSRAKHTSYDETRGMLRRLGATQSQILGAVINHF